MARKKETKEVKEKISLKDIEEKEKLIRDFENKYRFYSGIKWGIFLSLFGNLFILLLYDTIVKSFLKDKILIILVLIITAIILFIILTFLRDKQAEAEQGMEEKEKEVEEVKEKVK